MQLKLTPHCTSTVCVCVLSCIPTLCDPMDCSPPGSNVHGILQARILEWVAIPFSRGIFPTQGLNPYLLCLLRWQAGSLPLAPPGHDQKTGGCGGGHGKMVTYFVQKKSNILTSLYYFTHFREKFFYITHLPIFLTLHLTCLFSLLIHTKKKNKDVIHKLLTFDFL